MRGYIWHSSVTCTSQCRSSLAIAHLHVYSYVAHVFVLKTIYKFVKMSTNVSNTVMISVNYHDIR